MMTKLVDKVIIVTGGAGLLGSEFCLAISRAGAKVIVADINIKRAKEIEVKINALGFYADAFQVDINNQINIDDTIKKIDKRYGRIDAIINNAYPKNKNFGKKLEEVSYDDFNENLSLHLGGYFLIVQRFALYFKKQGYGNIINMSSIYGLIAPRFEIYNNTTMTMPVEYAVTKSAIIQLSRYFAKYYKKNNIRCNSLSIGGIEDGQDVAFLQKYNEFCSSKGMLLPMDVIGGLLFLLSDESLYVNGHNLVIDDGFTL